MDYDLTDIPEGYDLGRDHGPEYVSLWMDEIHSLLGGQRINGIADLGCGTGRFSKCLAARFNTKVINIDPSSKTGLNAIRAHAAGAEGMAVVEPIDLFLFRK